MKELLEKLKSKNIVVHLEKDDLRVKFSGSKLPEDVLKELRENKKAIVQYLSMHQKQSITQGIKPVEKSDYYPLSSSQRRLWILSKFERGNVAYNMTEALTFSGKLNMDALRYSFNSVIARHEILRTVFREIDGEVRQVILEPEANSLDIPLIDMRGVENWREEVYEKINREMDTPTDLENGPLMRAIVYQLNDDKHILFYSLHHIACDGWSIKVLTSELLHYYGIYGKKDPPLLPPLKIQYKDFAVWQQQQLDSGILNKHFEYWKEQFETPGPVLELPSDKVRPAIKTYNGSYIIRTIDRTLYDEFRLLYQQEGCTLFMGLLALVKALFYRYTGTEDITVGSPIAGRDHIELENQIGFYVNTLALRTHFSGNDSFKKLLAREKAVTLDAYQHQSYPFDELVSVLKQKRDISRNPLFDVMVVLLNSSMDASRQQNGYSGSDLSASGNQDLKKTSSLFDIRFSFKEKEQGLELMLEYNTDIYSEERIERMFTHFKGLLKAATQNPDSPLAMLNYLPEDEIKNVLETFNDTTHPFRSDCTLVDLFREQVNLSPSATAAVFRNESRTFLQLDKESNRLANLLILHTNLQHEARVGVLVARGFHQVVSLLAVLKAGAAYLPLDVDYPEDRLLYMLQDASVQVLIVEKAVAELANRLLWRCDGLKHIVCVDSPDFYSEQGDHVNTLMSQEMWDAVGDGSKDDIMGGGWMSSYTGEYFSKEEMKEYADNVLDKLKPFLKKEMRVLEIGCASGITTFQIAPFVATYYATDLSPVILEKTKQEAAARGLNNISFKSLAAHDIETAGEEQFDLVIINSVIHCFSGLNYLRDVLNKIIRLTADTGIIFLGDVMDLAKKDELVKDMVGFKMANQGKGYRTKIDWSRELFVSKDFLHTLTTEGTGVQHVVVSEKNGILQNELTKYRYDAVLFVDKFTADKQTKDIPGSKKVYSRCDIDLQPEALLPVDPVLPEALAYVIYTSGSSGKPKGCMLRHKGVVNRIEWMWSAYNFSKEDKILQKTTFTFDVSVWELFLPLCWGASMVICEKADVSSPERIRTLIKEHAVTCLHFVPGMLSMFMGYLTEENDFEQDFASLTKIFCSGEALPVDTAEKWYSMFDVPLYNLYGPTEASVDVTYFNVERSCRKIPIGKPIWNTYLYILDANAQLMPVGTDGEIYIGGVGLAKGYAGQEELTLERFVNDPFKPNARIYKTGDAGRWMPDGNIEYKGRKDEQIKIRGYRVELGEIEFFLKKHPDVQDAAVIARQNKDGDTELVAYLISGEDINYASLRSFLSAQLPQYMIPGINIRVKEFPVLSNGKTDRKALLQYEGFALSSGNTYCAPVTELEIKMVEVFEEVLNKRPVGVTDDFFEIGGDSFKAIRVAAKFKNEFSLMDIYKYPRIRDLAAFIDSSSSRSVLKLLAGDSNTCRSSVVIIPYGGGDPIAYQLVAAEMAQLSDEVAVYCLAIPRVPIDTTRIDFYPEMNDVVNNVMDEIRAQISTPVTIYTKCVAGGLGLELTRRLEQEQFPVTALCIGGAMALTQNPWHGPVFCSNDERIAMLRRIGATVPDDPEEQAPFCNNVNFDIAVNLAAYTYEMDKIESGEYGRLTTPLVCIVGTKDKTTYDYQTRYHSWYYYAEEVSLKEIQDVGHYFSRDKPKELATILHEICMKA